MIPLVFNELALDLSIYGFCEYYLEDSPQRFVIERTTQRQLPEARDVQDIKGNLISGWY